MENELDDLDIARQIFERNELKKHQKEELEKSGGKQVTISAETSQAWEILYNAFGDGLPEPVPDRENRIREFWERLSLSDNTVTKAIKGIQEGFIEAMMNK